MRTFAAIELPEPVKASLGSLSQRLRKSGAKASWVTPERMHLTLRFYGDLQEDAIAALRAFLREKLRGLGTFSLNIEGAGAFPSARKPAVVWAGIHPVEEPVLQVQRVTEAAAGAIGLVPERKSFTPHITLARIRQAESADTLSQFLNREQAFTGGAFPVSNVALWSSTLTPQGPMYSLIEEFDL